MNVSVPDLPTRPAWVEIDIAQLERNFAIINANRPAKVRMISVVKDDAYGHGSVEVARTAIRAGVEAFATVTLAEAIQLRDAGFDQKIVMLGERADAEIPLCVERDLTTCINSANLVKRISAAAQAHGKRASVHLKINTGMNRYGVHWTQAAAVAELIRDDANLKLDGVLSHFAMSDELDKTFAHTQLANFREALAQMNSRGIVPGIRHMCNSGGFLDLPEAHFDMVRVGILVYGVYPSKVCRRLPGIAPVMSVKTRISGFQNLQQGDKVGYGMRYTAEGPRRIAVLPIGYGDGFPRVRNTGCVLIGGQRAPIVGGVAMDSFTVDVTDLPEAKMWDEVVIIGKQSAEELTVHDVAALTGTVSYAVLTSWRSRLPRVYVNRSDAGERSSRSAHPQTRGDSER